MLSASEVILFIHIYANVKGGWRAVFAPPAQLEFSLCCTRKMSIGHIQYDFVCVYIDLVEGDNIRIHSEIEG